MTKYETLQIILSAFLLAAAIIAACIYGAQLSEMGQSTAAATKAAKAAEDSVTLAKESARIDQRAWVAVTGIVSLPEANKPFVANANLRNSGKTFAKSVVVTVHSRVIENKIDEPAFEQSPPESNSVSILPPSADFECGIYNTKILPQVAIDKLYSGEIRLFVFGKITYKDIFNCPHWTTFCYVFHPASRRFVAYKTYNEIDEAQ